MADVFRGKYSAVKAIPGYCFHGVTAILAMWLVFQAVSS